MIDPSVTYGPITGTPFDNFSPGLFWLMVVVLLMLIGAQIYFWWLECEDDL